MAEVETTGALFLMALRDLHDGERAQAERLAKVAGHASYPAFVAFIDVDRQRSARQQTDLARIARMLDAEPQGEPNIWMRAILDDAGNDAATIAAGPLRDIAMIGALRKAKQSERVSYETAIALADRLELDEACATLTRIRDEEQQADETLARLLVQLCGEEH